MKLFKKKPKIVDYTKIEDVIKLLNSRKTTVEDVMDGLQSMIWKFQDIKENTYLEEIEQKVDNEEIDLEEFNVHQWAQKIEHQILIDSKAFVDNYVSETEDKILDAINDKQIKKDPAHAFLILLQSMKKAFADIE